MSGPWQPTPALTRAVVVGVAAAVVAVVSGRGGLAVVAAPLLAASVWAALTRPTRRPRVAARTPTPVAAVGSRLTWQVDVDAVPGLRDVVAILPSDDGVTTSPSHGHVAAAARGGTHVSVAVDGVLERWGPRRLGPAQVAAYADLAAWVWQPEETLTADVAALPQPDVFTSSAPLPHPVGLVGSHRSARHTPRPSLRPRASPPWPVRPLACAGSARRAVPRPPLRRWPQRRPAATEGR